MEEMLFNRDAELAEAWMAARESVLQSDDGESTDVLMKKQKDFEKAIAIHVSTQSQLDSQPSITLSKNVYDMIELGLCIKHGS